MAEEAEEELQTLQEIYEGDFVRVSSRECTVRLSQPWQCVVLCFVLPGKFAFVLV